MEDETLTNVLNLLQKTNTNNQSNQSNNSSSSNLNNDIQTLLIKFLLSGGLNQIMNFQNNNQSSTQTTPEKPRTIDLKNYQRLD